MEHPVEAITHRRARCGVSRERRLGLSHRVRTNCTQGKTDIECVGVTKIP